jgi:hypothetical protein
VIDDKKRKEKKRKPNSLGNFRSLEQGQAMGIYLGERNGIS